MARGIVGAAGKVARTVAIAAAVATTTFDGGGTVGAAGGAPSERISLGEALVQKGTGVVQLTVTCAKETGPAFSELRFAVRQGQDGASAVLRETIGCDADGESTALLIRPKEGHFRPGSARVTVSTRYVDEDGDRVRHVFVSERVRLESSVGIG